MTRLDDKLARIVAGRYRPSDFIIADAKDGDMGPSISIASLGPHRAADGSWTRKRTRAEFLDQIRAIVRQDILDVMLVSASNVETLSREGLFRDSAVKPAIRANDTTDIWVGRGCRYNERPSQPFRSADLARVRPYTDLGLYAVTFNHDIDADVASLAAFADFRKDAAANDFTYFLEVFNPNVETGIAPDLLPHYVNDCIARCLAGLVAADRPRFLKMPYNGPKALEELAGYDPSGLIVGVLGGGAGTTRDTFELLAQAEKYGARVALFGRKINQAEAPLSIVALMREVSSHNLTPDAAVRAYHADLQRQGIKATRPLDDDNQITEAVLKQAAA
jgi:DhnA family fructose-bisphosphate aldolase class Ia